MSDDLHERLTDYLSRMETGPFELPADGIVKVNAESMADAILPFINRETARWAARAGQLHGVLSILVALKDGPRDDHYRQSKDAAWQRAREVLEGE